MSGGSWDYVYHHFDEVADRLQRSPHSPLRRALGRHVALIAKAMHDIEWVDSSDYSDGQETEAIRAALGDRAKAMVLDEAVDEARKCLSELEKAIREATS